MRILHSILFFLSITCIFFASGIDYITGDYGFLFPVAFVISAIIIATSKLFSGVFLSESLNAWARTEIRELVVTLVLFVLAVAAVDQTGNFIVAMTQASGGNVTDANIAAKTVLDSMIKNYVDAYSDVVRAMARLRFVTSYSSYSSTGFIFYFGYGMSKNAGAFPLLSPLSFAASMLSNTILFYKSLSLLLGFLGKIGPNFLFPVAFAIRAFPFTRRLGNTLIALSLGAIILLPLSIALTIPIHELVGGLPAPHLTSSQLHTLSGGSSGGGLGKAIVSPVCGNQLARFTLGLGEWPFAFTVCLPLLGGIITAPLYPGCVSLVAYTIYPLMQTVMSLGLGAILMTIDLISTDFDAPAAFNIIHDFSYSIVSLLTISYVDLFLIGIITISGIRALSSALGGEGYLPAVEKLI